MHEGLVFKNEVFTKLDIGDKIEGYVKHIREDLKMDISLQPIGYKNFNDANCNMILEALSKNDGFIAITDKSAPYQISEMFGISKKAFKKSIGTLYKQGKITITDTGIKLV